MSAGLVRNREAALAQDDAEKELRSADHLKRLSAERARQNRIRTVLGGGVFSLFLIFALTIAQQFRNFDSARLEVQMNARASASLWPIVSEELDALTPKVLPPLDSAFRAESPRYLPRLIQHLDVEEERYVEDVEEQGDRLVKEAIERALEARSEEIAALKMNPLLLRYEGTLEEATDEAEEAFAAMLERAQGWARAELDHVFEEEDKVLEHLREQARLAGEENASKERLGDLLISLIAVVQAKSGRGG